MDKRLSVTKANALIEASYRLSLNEMRVLLYGISLINPTKDELPKELKIDINRFSEFFGIDAHDRGFYSELKEAVAVRLWNREIGYADLERGSVSKERWLTHVTYCDSEAVIELSFNLRIGSLLQQLKGNFTKYYLEEIGEMKCVYSVCLFELCSMQLNRAEKPAVEFVIPIEELRRRFALEDKYPRFSSLKSRVLEPARKEINKHSSLKIKYEAIKRGRTPREVQFFVERKQEPGQKSQKSKRLTRKDIEAKAHPGETWEDAKRRLSAAADRCPDTRDMFG